MEQERAEERAIVHELRNVYNDALRQGAERRGLRGTPGGAARVAGVTGRKTPRKKVPARGANGRWMQVGKRDFEMAHGKEKRSRKAQRKGSLGRRKRVADEDVMSDGSEDYEPTPPKSFVFPVRRWRAKNAGLRRMKYRADKREAEDEDSDATPNKVRSYYRGDSDDDPMF
jgi:hypothetical protein